MSITFGSLFAGIGGFDLGFERAGMVCRWQVEIDDYANRVLAKHWPDVHRERDIRECGRHNLEPVDIIAAGFPCTDISIANTQAEGLEGSRSGLFFEAVRVVGELQPRCVVLENVPAIFIRGIDRVLSSMASIGFDAEWRTIPASAFGLPHKRDRFFLVCHAHGARRKGHKPFLGAPIRTKAPFAVNSHTTVDTWSAMVRGHGTRRSSDGLSVAMDRSRLKGLGNAVVPQCAEWIGRQIMETLE